MNFEDIPRWNCTCEILPLSTEPLNGSFYVIVAVDLKTGDESIVYEKTDTGHLLAYTSTDWEWIRSRFDYARSVAESHGRAAFVRMYQLHSSREI